MNITSRLAAFIDVLLRYRLDAILLTDRKTRFWATGVSTSSGLVLITPRQSYLMVDFRYLEGADACKDYFTVLETSAKKTQQIWISEILGKRKKIGFDAMGITSAAHEKWKKDLPGCTWFAIDQDIAGMRVIKDPQEQKALRSAQKIAEKAWVEVLANFIKPDITERSLAAELVYRMLRHGADGISFDPIVVSGKNGSLPHGSPTDKPIRNGEFVTLDFGCVKDGYCSDMTRTVSVGSASDEMRRVYDVVLQAQAAGIAAAKEGVLGRDVDKAAREVIAEAGYGDGFGHGFGHGIGLSVHEPPSANYSGNTPLPAGSVISAEPGIYLPGRFGVRIEDMLLITETGCENLTKAGKDLLVL
ncbi:MAG: Xaa-Pro peptidase family protein [Oscillospiraceae bacterium]|nr:Xaa-Pro peptidase family protein [Oscillospiraceae bacterium]